MTLQTSVPETPEALTAEWLSAALGSPIDHVRQEVLGCGQGFLGDIVRLHLASTDRGLPATVIAKLPKKANRAMGEMLGVYEREVMFFQDFAGRLPVRTPGIYYTHYDPDAGSARQKSILRFIDGLPRILAPAISHLGRRVADAKQRRYLILMEDLGTLEPGDQLAGASASDCALALRQIAPLHRHYWGAAELEQRFWLLPMEIDARLRHAVSRPGFRHLADEPHEAVAACGRWLDAHYAALMRALAAQAPRTLVHGDLRLDNVCYDHGGDGCTFLDWQLTRAGPAAYDVAYFLGGALGSDVGAGEEDAILRDYHQALGRDDYPFERLQRDYQRGLVLSLAAVAPTADIVIDAGRGQQMMAVWRERLAARLRRVDLAALL